MAQAKRKSDTKPKAAAPANAFDNAVQSEALARALLSLEPGLCNLDRMAGLCLSFSDDESDPRSISAVMLGAAVRNDRRI
jgi:hypothetical protein